MSQVKKFKPSRNIKILKTVMSPCFSTFVYIHDCIKKVNAVKVDNFLTHSMNNKTVCKYTFNWKRKAVK